MATSSSCLLSMLPLVALGCLALASCDSPNNAATELDFPGRYAVVQVEGLAPGSREVLQIDTANGNTWRLVKSTMPGSYDDIGWHPIADLTIESRSPYYRNRPAGLPHIGAEGGR